MENLEAKYAGGKNGERQEAMEEPSEEAFQKTATRIKKRKARDITEDKDNEEDIDLQQDSPAKEPVAPTKRRRSKRTKQSKR